MRAPIENSKNEVTAFTDNGKFISHDVIHLTPNGAKYYAQIYNEFLTNLVTSK